MTNHAQENSGHLVEFVTRFEAGDADAKAAVFYELFTVTVRLGETATAAQELIDDADTARNVAEDSLQATTESFETRLAAAETEKTRLIDALDRARTKMRSLQEELSAANMRIIHLTEANDEFAEEVEGLTGLVERGEIRPQYVVGFTLLGILLGGTKVYAKTPGSEKPQVVVRVQGTNMVVGPKIDPSVFSTPPGQKTATQQRGDSSSK